MRLKKHRCTSVQFATGHKLIIIATFVESERFMKKRESTSMQSKYDFIGKHYIVARSLKF